MENLDCMGRSPVLILLMSILLVPEHEFSLQEQSFAAMKDTCTWSQNTHGNSWGDINRFKGQLQSNNTAPRLKEILIAADSFWVPRDRTQALNPLHRAITAASSTVALKAVSHKIYVFYYQKKILLIFCLCSCSFSCRFASREQACWSKY